MRPSSMMWLGAIVSAIAMVASIFAPDAAGFVMFAFAGGALFGKGYGILEERGKL